MNRYGAEKSWSRRAGRARRDQDRVAGPGPEAATAGLKAPPAAADGGLRQAFSSS
jgi:hypothetical protein